MSTDFTRPSSDTVEALRASVESSRSTLLGELGELVAIPGIAWDSFDAADAADWVEVARRRGWWIAELDAAANSAS